MTGWFERRLEEALQSNSSSLEPTDPTVYNVSHFVLAGLYFALTLVTLGLVVVKALRGSLRELWKVFFFLFVIFAAVLRGLWALFDPLMLMKTVQISNRTDLFLDLFPSILFFACYLILLFLWVELYHYPARAGLRIHSLRFHLFFVLGLMFCIFGVLFVVDLVVFDSSWVSIAGPANIVERILILYIATLYLVTCVAFTVYGLLVLVPLWRSPTGSSAKRRDMLLRLLGLTMLIMVIFLVRAAFVFIGFFSNWSFVAYFDLLYYVTCEVLPIVTMFFILLYRGTSASHTGLNSSINQNLYIGAGGVAQRTGSLSDERSPLVSRIK